MKNKLLSIAFLTLFLASCKSETQTDGTIKLECNVTSIQQLSWFQLLIDGKGSCKIYDGASLYQYEFGGNQVFYLYNPASSLGICNRFLYDCSGNCLSTNWIHDYSQWVNFENKRKNEKLLWSK